MGRIHGKSVYKYITHVEKISNIFKIIGASFSTWVVESGRKNLACCMLHDCVVLAKQMSNPCSTTLMRFASRPEQQFMLPIWTYASDAEASSYA